MTECRVHHGWCPGPDGSTGRTVDWSASRISSSRRPGGSAPACLSDLKRHKHIQRQTRSGQAPEAEYCDRRNYTGQLSGEWTRYQKFDFPSASVVDSTVNCCCSELMDRGKKRGEGRRRREEWRAYDSDIGMQASHRS